MEEFTNELLSVLALVISGVMTLVIETLLVWSRNRLRRYARNPSKTQEFMAVLDEHYEDTQLGKHLADIRKRLKELEEKHND